MDRQTDGWMDGRTDTSSYRDARTHLKRGEGSDKRSAKPSQLVVSQDEKEIHRNERVEGRGREPMTQSSGLE